MVLGPENSEYQREMKIKPGKPLPAKLLARNCEPAKLKFDSTEALSSFNEIPGQNRAAEAIHFATGMDVDGHNVFVLGPPGVGRHTFVRTFLKEKAVARKVPNDWCYVNNFEDPRRPRALELPPGISKQLRVDVEHVVEDAQTAIPAAFESEDFQTQHDAIQGEYKEQQEKAFADVEREANSRNIGVVPTPTGIVFVPLRDGETIAPGEFDKLPRQEQEKVKKDIEELTASLQHVMRTAPKLGREIRQKIHQLEREVASLAVAGLIDDLIEKYQDLPDVVSHLQRMQEDIVENVSLFLPQSQGQGVLAQLGGSSASRELAVIRRYAINVLVDRSDCEGAPVVFEDQPSFTELIGKIEHEAEFGTLVTNLSLIQAGALHRANGGYLVMDVDKVFSYPASWEGLKRAMKSGEIRVRSLGDEFGLVSTVSLEPEPIPLDLKVILIGERKYYYLLARLDPEFSDLFKVAADFEDDIKRSDENIDLMTRLLATTVRKDNLKHLSREGVARIIDESSRQTADVERMSADIRQTTDLLREAHYWASQDNKELIDADDVERAVESRIRRTSRLRERMLEETVRETLVIETDGTSIGQVNGLAVLQLGDYSFGRPQRITATVTLGSGQLIDIEREVKLGGPLHSKGVLILSGFLRSYYVTDRPLCLSASLVFEQSYGDVDGDSASAAEFCALSSALAETPVRQSLAITGSIDQHGRVQAIGGVNQKIEGFYEICKARGLSGDQGVLIPVANVKHLMLRREVVAAVQAGEFNVYAVDHVDQCLQLLTGLPAGKRNKSGDFTKGSVNQKIRERLLDFAHKRQTFSGAGPTRDQ